jgi:hypothetical protein
LAVFVVEYLCKYESIFETALAYESVDPGVRWFNADAADHNTPEPHAVLAAAAHPRLFDKKNQWLKISKVNSDLSRLEKVKSVS